MVKHTETISRLLPTNCLNVFDHFVGLVLQGLSDYLSKSYRVLKGIVLQIEKALINDHLHK